MATSNRLIPILGLIGVSIVAVVMFKQCSGGPIKDQPMKSVPAPSLPETAGADNDTPEETLRTVITSNRELREQVAEIVAQNERLLRENQSLRTDPPPVLTEITDTDEESEPAQIDASDQDHRETVVEEEQQSVESPSTFGRAVDQASQTVAAVTGAAGSRFGPMVGMQPQAQLPEPTGVVAYTTMAPMGYALESEASSKGGVERTRYVRTTVPNVPVSGPQAGPATRAARKAAREEDERYFTIPENATLVGATAMTSLIGRVPIDGRVTDPMQFKAVIGRDNLAANGFELPPDIAGMIVTGISIGDMALSCNEGRVQSATFVFNDGTIQTISERSRNRSSNTGVGSRSGGKFGGTNDYLGFISDEHGNPCIPGQFVTNAPAYLTDVVGLGVLGVAGQAYADAQRTVYSGSDGSTSTVTGNVGHYALGQAVSGATNEVTQWLMERLNNSFDAVVTPSGKKLVVHLDQELAIDKTVEARKLVYRQQGGRQLVRGEHYGLE